MDAVIQPSLVFATAMAVSAGTLILFDLWLLKQLQIKPSFGQEKRPLRPCLSKGGKKPESRKTKRVQFAADVVEPRGNGEKYRRDRRREKSAGIRKVSSSCGMPENRMALYTGMMRDRMQLRMQFSY